MRALRITAAVLAALFAAGMGYVALTVPTFAATGPAVLLLAALLVAYVAWPKQPRH